MNAAQWIEKARSQIETLAPFVDEWHPVRNPSGKSDKTQRITAPGAEEASEVVRRAIAAENHGLRNPGDAFRVAVAAGNYDTAYSLLNSAWFGVPESTSCWRIKGFSEAVALLEDPAADEQDAPEDSTEQTPGS